jgi:hypothetical protein
MAAQLTLQDIWFHSYQLADGVTSLRIGPSLLLPE